MKTTLTFLITLLLQILSTVAKSPTTTCSGSANTAVPIPQSITDTSQLLLPIWNSHTLFFTSKNLTFPSQAALAPYCLEQYVAYQGNSTCLSFGTRMSATVNFCTGFDVELGEADFVPVEVGETEQYGLGVNPVCGGTFRAY